MSSGSSIEVVEDTANPTTDSPLSLPKPLPTPDIPTNPSSEALDDPFDRNSSQSSLPLFPPTSPSAFHDPSSDAIASCISSSSGHLSGCESERSGRARSVMAKVRAHFKRSFSRVFSDTEQDSNVPPSPPNAPTSPHSIPRTSTSSFDRSRSLAISPPSPRRQPSSSTKKGTSVSPKAFPESTMASSEESLPMRVSGTSIRHPSPANKTTTAATASTSKHASTVAEPSNEAPIRSKRSNSDGEDGPTPTAPKRARVKGDSSIRRGFEKLAKGATKGSVMAFFQKKLTAEEKKEQSARIDEEVALQREKQQETEERRETESKAKGKVSVLERVRKFRAKKKDQEIASGVRDPNGRKRKASVSHFHLPLEYYLTRHQAGMYRE